ncbi:MAG: hypothetical protein NZM31_12770 [Gemmatales bacterium]|nr:hypothetical protein [Gemmatales bacterium]MDW8387868.1 hypothetical protein [Gemmatales bacterium]
MTGRITRVILIAAGIGIFGPAGAQPEINRFNERTAAHQPSPQDREGIWVLDFHFKDPRVMVVDIPGRGRKHVWYLWYQVSNNTGEPRPFVPDFIWVCHDENTAHHDQVLPAAQAEIRRVEDPNNLLDIKNSVTITKAPIPVSKEFEGDMRVAFPKMVTGVATWDDINPRSTQFSIYVFGLSDGWAVTDGPDGKPIVRRKALQLKFRRLGDQFSRDSSQIRFVGHQWVYATSELPPLTVEDPATASKGQKEAEPAP